MTEEKNNVVCQFDDNYRVTESTNEYRVESRTPKGWKLRDHLQNAKSVPKALLSAIEQDARDKAGKEAIELAMLNSNYDALADLPVKGK